MEQKILSRPEHLTSPLAFSGICAAQSLVFLYGFLSTIVCHLGYFPLAIVLYVLL